MFVDETCSVCPGNVTARTGCVFPTLKLIRPFCLLCHCSQPCKRHLHIDNFFSLKIPSSSILVVDGSVGGQTFILNWSRNGQRNKKKLWLKHNLNFTWKQALAHSFNIEWALLPFIYLLSNHGFVPNTSMWEFKFSTLSRVHKSTM